ncbi:MAG: metallophosphoesterase family protein [Planctomycetales bacterium]|nr:metallophosphoesterase family protein [Planctomycetales bacterium]
MRRAIISDIHGNLDALETVLKHIAEQNVAEVFCLGDIIGYGPNPCECLDLVRKRTNVCLLGNHDQAALFDPEGFNTGAERAIFWTRDQLENGTGLRNDIDARWDFLGALPRTYRADPWLFVHGSARNPVNEYVFPEDVYNQKKMEKLFSLIDRGCFQGHTHVPGVFTESRTFLAPEETNHVYTVSDSKFMVNVGSVGQPRDGDPRAAFCVYDTEAGEVTFHRLNFDIDKVAAEVREYAFGESLAKRLYRGV